MLRLLVPGLSILQLASSAYVWPSKYDHIDDLLYMQSGFIRNGELADQVQSCAFGAGQPGIQKSAEWIRTAFHDSITHDASTKVGGLDASIQYELDRRENLGSALNSTFADISSSYDIQTSAADLIALALVMAVAKCGDLYVPLRLGRIDATDAGIMGVPEAETDLNTSKQRFATAGFSDTEMITLVACGHTVGGVHSVDHPEIVTEGGVSAANVARFDTTTGAFDTAVVAEYLNDTTNNPLVRATNNTLNSDLRIFASDGNQTMSKLEDPAFFKSQCESLLERMLDLVPGEVSLTEPLVPADIRPDITSYQIRGNTIELAGNIRVRTSSVTGRDPADLGVTIQPSGLNSTEIATTLATYKGGYSSGYLQERMHFYEFNQTLAAGAIDSFNIELETKSSGTKQTVDNAGTGGFPLNSDILFQAISSCSKYDAATVSSVVTVVAAIRQTMLDQSGATPKMVIVHRNKVAGSFMPRLSQETIEMERTSKIVAGYVYYQAKATVRDNTISKTTFDLEVGESKLQYISTAGLSQNVCEVL